MIQSLAVGAPGLFWLALALVGAAFVRGYSGFGFSAIFIAASGLVTNPLPLIPVVFLCEIAMTGFQARGIRGHVDWGRVWPLLFGAAVTIPAAVWVLAHVGPDMARFVVSLIILILSIVLWSGWRLERQIGRIGHIGVGLLSGLANGAGVGGLPVAAFLTAQPISAVRFRASMIVFLTGIDLMTLPVMWANGLVGGHTLTAAAAALPLLGFGLWLGGRRFGSASPTEFRRMAIMLLMGLSALALLRVLM